jgi:hypothetical protein
LTPFKDGGERLAGSGERWPFPNQKVVLLLDKPGGNDLVDKDVEDIQFHSAHDVSIEDSVRDFSKLPDGVGQSLDSLNGSGHFLLRRYDHGTVFRERLVVETEERERE